MELIVESLIYYRDMLSQHPLFTVGIMLVIGYSIGILAEKVRLPEITGFILAGLIMGSTVTGIVPHHMEESLKVVTEVALGLIALTIGGEFYWAKLKRMGKEVVLITIVQIMLTFLVVSIGLFLFKMPLPFALLLGAIASATAPAATVAIVQSLRAHGVFIDYLYGVVALDDAGCVILFSIVFAIASGMLLGDTAAVEAASHAVANHGGIAVIGHAFLEVLLSIIAGIVSGIAVHFSTWKKKNTNEIMIISIGIVFLFTAMAVVLKLSPLLTNMAAGAVIINFSAKNHRIFRALEPFTPPLYALFFVIAGTELDPAVLVQKDILIFGMVYILLRAAGKYGGVYIGCKVSKVKGVITKHLGLCMLPQAGVAIGLVLMIQASPLTHQLNAEQVVMIDRMVNIVLLSVFVNELVGPPVSRYAIIKGNEMEG
ncbi:MAG: cation:proton antiporter [Spirochaetota bacterium]|nr:cation:proton antiporter [Spirochaetota bacterium]